MRYASAEGLSAELRGELLRSLSAAKEGVFGLESLPRAQSQRHHTRGGSSADRGTSRSASAWPSVGIGISPSRFGSDDYRIALRPRTERDLELMMRGSRALSRVAASELDVEFGSVRALAGHSSASSGNHRIPLPPGSAVQHAAGGVGTVGAFVTDGSGDVMMLSNNHVLAALNRGRKDDDIFHPDCASGRVVAKLEWWEPLHLNLTANKVDMALASPTTTTDPTLSHFGPLTGILPFGQQWIGNLQVKKCGNSFKVTQGYVSALMQTQFVEYENGRVILNFEDVIEVDGGGTAFSEGGDSGSLVIEPTHKKAVGVLFAGGSTRSYFFTMDAAFACRPGLTLVT